MDNQTHIVQKTVLHVNMSSRKKAIQHQQEISQFFKQQNDANNSLSF